jgi:flavin reductase (DIM6/NTAB) family NADH-FMN oxidoreductase RutF
VPSKLIRPPRVAESPIHLECKYHGTWTLPANRRHSAHHVVIGEVIGIHIRDDVIGADGKIDIKKIRPLARLGYMDYTSVTEVFTMQAQGNAAGQIGEAVAKRMAAV